MDNEDEKKVPNGGNSDDQQDLAKKTESADDKGQQKPKLGAYADQMGKATRAEWDKRNLRESIESITDLGVSYMSLLDENAKLKEQVEKGVNTKTFSDEDYAEVSAVFESDAADDGSISKGVFALLKKHGVSPEEIRSVLPVVGADKTKLEVARQLRETNLKAVWGDNFEKNINLYNRGISKLFTGDDLKRVQEKGLTADPDFCSLVAEYTKTKTDGVVADNSWGDKPLSDEEVFASFKG